MNCKNCGFFVSENYCSRCGQKNSVDRIKISSFSSELAEVIFQVNKGFFYTFKSLTNSPGKSIQDYLNGKRQYFFKPIAYLLLLSTLYFLVSKLTSQNTIVANFIEGYALSCSEKAVQLPPIIKWFTSNYAYTTLTLLPFFSFCSYLMFINQQKNYLEHLVINSFVTGQQAIIYTFFAVLTSFSEYKALELLPTVLCVGYNFWVYWQLFSKGNRFLNVLCSALTYILFLVVVSGLFISLVNLT